MDFLETLSLEILERVAPRLSEAIVQNVMSELSRESELVRDRVFCLSEDEAAEKLGIAPTTLARIRKDKLIEYTYSALPKMNENGQRHGGRVSYLPRHLDEYLARNEQKRFFGNRNAK